MLGAPDGPAARAAIDEASLHRIMEFCAGEEVAPEYVPFVEEEANFDGNDRRRFVWRRAPDDAVRRSFRVGIIGAGLGGLCAAIRLEQAGIPYTVFEKNPDVGGTWYENTYPDLRVDVPNHFYSYSFRPNPDWSHYYARRDELAEYIETCAKEYGVLPNVRFRTEVLDRRLRRTPRPVGGAAPRPGRRHGRASRGRRADQRGRACSAGP